MNGRGVIVMVGDRVGVDDSVAVGGTGVRVAVGVWVGAAVCEAVALGRGVGVSVTAAGAQPARKRDSRRMMWIVGLRIVCLGRG